VKASSKEKRRCVGCKQWFEKHEKEPHCRFLIRQWCGLKCRAAQKKETARRERAQALDAMPKRECAYEQCGRALVIGPKEALAAFAKRALCGDQCRSRHSGETRAALVDYYGVIVSSKLVYELEALIGASEQVSRKRIHAGLLPGVQFVAPKRKRAPRRKRSNPEPQRRTNLAVIVNMIRESDVIDYRRLAVQLYGVDTAKTRGRARNSVYSWCTLGKIKRLGRRRWGIVA
jgi:hypothetical protein